MSAGKKILLGFAALLIVGGIALFVVVMAANGWDFSKMSTQKMLTNTYEVNEDFDSISITGSTEDILFAASSDGKCRVVCTENEKRLHTVKVEDGTLKIVENDTSSWIDNIGFSFESSKTTLYLPKNDYAKLNVNVSTGDVTVPNDFHFTETEIKASTGDVSFSASVEGRLKISLSTGDITLDGKSAGSVELEVSTGKIKMSSVAVAGDVKFNVSTGDSVLDGVNCVNLITDGSTGDVTFKNVIASGRLSATRSTGKIKFDHSDAAEITVNTSSGDVTGTLLTGKIFTAKASSGDVDVPESEAGGKCKITTSSGDIQIEIAK